MQNTHQVTGGLCLSCLLFTHILPDLNALFNPKTTISMQKRDPYTGNPNSETLGDGEDAFLHWGNILRFSQHLEAAMVPAAA